MKPILYLSIDFPSAPRSAMLSSSTTTSLSIYWQRPSSLGGGNLQGYRVGYRRRNLPFEYRYTQSTQITLSNLLDDTEYIIEVRASNDAGYGPSNTITVRTTKPGITYFKSILVEYINSINIVKRSFLVKNKLMK